MEARVLSGGAWLWSRARLVRFFSEAFAVNQSAVWAERVRDFFRRSRDWLGKSQFPNAQTREVLHPFENCARIVQVFESDGPLAQLVEQLTLNQ